ncbi:MAG: HEAT repeat domain-containing protein [Deltaproteobacteria bacterium]|nr:HEAT repeat domain-containing protein [Deltaproteobacteria bacterium]
MGLFSKLFGGGKAQQNDEAKDEAKAAAEAEEAKADPAAERAELAADLDSSNGAARVDAGRALLDRWRAGDNDAAEVMVARLPALFEDSEPQVRMIALACVRQFRKRENLEKHTSATLALLADPVSQVRTSAVWAVARLPGDVARAQLRAVLGHQEEAMRFAAAVALADLKDPSCLKELTTAIGEQHRRHEALSALMALGDASAAPAVKEQFDDERIGDLDRTACAAALVRLGDASGKPYLLERLASAYGDDRPNAVEWAGLLGVTEAIDALTQISDDPDDLCNGAALKALARLKAPGIEARLLAIAQDPKQPDLRLDAAEGLAELGTPECRAALETLAKSDDEELAETARESLHELAVADAIKKAEADALAAADSARADAAKPDAASSATAGPPPSST